MSPGPCSRVLWAFASLGYTPERLLFTGKADWAYEFKGGKRNSRRGALGAVYAGQAATSWLKGLP